MSGDPSGKLADRSNRLDLIFACVISLVLGILLLATSRDYAMTWDEGHTVYREQLLANWFAHVFFGNSQERVNAFSKNRLTEYWPFAREEPDGHPPFYALLGLAGWAISRSMSSPLTSYRFGPMALAAATAGCVYYALARRRGRWAGLVASVGMFTIPQVFSLAHYAHYDMPMSCLWILAQLAFLRAKKSWSWAIVFGVLVGLTIGNKFTGVFALIPAVLWVITFEWLPRIRFTPSKGIPTTASLSLRGTAVVIVGGLVAAITLYAILPPWWADPINGVSRFLISNLTRQRTKPIPTLYMGTIYPFALPWHNTLVLSAISLPVGLLILGALGACASWFQRPIDREGVLWFFSWLILMIIRGLPFTPGHDGVRLLLPSVLSMTILAGIGVGYVDRWLSGRKRPWLLGLIVAASLGDGLIGIAQLYPYTLSYYNAASGGLKGAERRGFELTYYWDTLGPEFLQWVRAEDKRRELSLRFPSDLINVRYLRMWNVIPTRIPIIGMDHPEQPDYVIQRRRGVYYPYDSWLEENGKPEFVIRRQGVDLLRIYSYPEAFQAYSATKDMPTPEHLRD